MNLGLDASSVMGITPRYFDALLLQFERKTERSDRAHDFLLSQLVAMVANTGFRSFEEIRQPAEFLPLYPSDRTETALRRRSHQAITKQLERTMERAARYQAAQVARGAE